MSLTQSQEVVLYQFGKFKKQHFPSLSDGLAFMQYATSLALQEFQLSPADIQVGVTEGKDDGGLDGFHIIVNKTEAVSESTRGLSRRTPPPGVPKNVPFDVVIVQSKSTSSGTLDGGAIPKLHEVLDLILSGATSATLSAYPLHASLVNQIESFRKYRTKLVSLDPIRSFTVYVMQPIAESKITGPHRRGAAAMAKMIQGHLGATTKVRVEILGADGIERLRTTPSDVEGILKFAMQPLVENHGKSDAWVGLVSVKEFLAFIRRDKGRALRDEFFTTNVRDFAGTAGSVNSAIHNSLSNDSPTAFWWMNNGVTILVDRAAFQSDNAFLLSNPQIVNGLQTSNVIHEAAQAKTVTTKRLKESMLVRVISELDPAVRESIIQGTNNQTHVTSVQLYANDPLQVEIESYLETQGWYYERRRWQFRGRSVSRSRIRSIVELAQVVIAGLLLEPDTARARPRDRLSPQSSYSKVFDPSNPFALYAKLLTTQEAIEAYLRTPKALSISDDPTNDRYYLLAGAVLRQSGVRVAADLTATVLDSRLTIPTDSLLADVHARLYALVGTHPDKKSVDRMFKGKDLRVDLINEILAWNSSTPVSKV